MQLSPIVLPKSCLALCHRTGLRAAAAAHAAAAAAAATTPSFILDHVAKAHGAAVARHPPASSAGIAAAYAAKGIKRPLQTPAPATATTLRAAGGCGGSSMVASVDLTGADSAGDADSEVCISWHLACHCCCSGMGGWLLYAQLKVFIPELRQA
jgi:hypothetical protein